MAPFAAPFIAIIFAIGINANMAIPLQAQIDVLGSASGATSWPLRMPASPSDTPLPKL